MKDIPLGLMNGKKGIIFGVANDRSPAWHMAERLHAKGAGPAFTHLPPPKTERRVRLRTSAARRFKKTRSGVYLVQQVLVRLSQARRRLKAAHLCGQVPLPEAKKTRAKVKSQAA